MGSFPDDLYVEAYESNICITCALFKGNGGNCNIIDLHLSSIGTSNPNLLSQLNEMIPMRNGINDNCTLKVPLTQEPMHDYSMRAKQNPMIPTQPRLQQQYPVVHESEPEFSNDELALLYSAIIPYRKQLLDAFDSKGMEDSVKVSMSLKVAQVVNLITKLQEMLPTPVSADDDIDEPEKPRTKRNRSNSKSDGDGHGVVQSDVSDN